MRWIKCEAPVLLLIVLSTAGCSHAAEHPRLLTSVSDLDWLAGHWEHESADGSSRNEELWLAPAGGMMLGVNRTIEDGRAVFFEFLMIREVNGRTAYLAMPGGQTPPTVFPLVETSASMTAIFENPDHDFPKRIVYQRTGDDLTATLTGASNEEGEPRIERWDWCRFSGSD